MARLISEAEVERLLDPDALIRGIAEALKALTAGQAIQPSVASCPLALQPDLILRSRRVSSS